MLSFLGRMFHLLPCGVYLLQAGRAVISRTDAAWEMFFFCGREVMGLELWFICFLFFFLEVIGNKVLFCSGYLYPLGVQARLEFLYCCSLKPCAFVNFIHLLIYLLAIDVCNIEIIFAFLPELSLYGWLSISKKYKRGDTYSSDIQLCIFVLI